MKNVLVALVAVVMGTLPALALEGPGRALIASNTEQIANNPVQTATDGSTILVTFVPPYSGTVRVKWDFKSKDGTSVFSQADVPHLSNCVAESTGTAYSKGSCDVRVMGGMPITISAFASQTTNTAYLRNVSLSYKIVDSDGEIIPYQLPQLQ
jgi:hypothetical protein